MKKVLLTALVGGLFAAGCADLPVEGDHAFGESVASMIEAQTLDPAAGGDADDAAALDGEGRRLENVLEGYRKDNARGTTDVKRNVTFTVGN